MKWVIASDHGGMSLLEPLAHFLGQKGDEVLCLREVGDAEKSNYPDDADACVSHVLDGSADVGLLLCGTGIGVSMRANRYKGIRAAVVHDEFTAEMAKAHNNANVLCLGARVLDEEQALACLTKFYETEFEGGRHEERIEKLDEPLVNEE